MAPIIATATGPGGDHIASLVQQWVTAAEAMLKDDLPANGVLLRGWSGRPVIPPFPELWKLRAAAITAYPMYRGVAELCGMTPILGAHSFEEEVALLKQHWDEYDFFFVHYKYADSAGEDGDFRRKQEAISAFDVWVPEIVDLKPDVLVVTGDHSTPATMASHSWHHVPLLLWGNNVRPDDKHQFSETLCRGGELGDLLAKEVMPVAMAHAGRLARYGA
jgi:2,3-bisphosphoglycerate-independent phosphoglycerate mutase